MSGVSLFVGGVFHGQTTEIQVPSSGLARVTIPIVSTDLSAFTMSDALPRSLVEERADYEVGGPRELRYFTAWRDVQGRRLIRVLLGPKVQRMGMQVRLMASEEPPCPYSADVAEAYLRLESGRRRDGDDLAAMLVDAEVWTRWRAEWNRWAEMRERQEESALRAVRDSHLVNRQVSPVLREETREELWPGATIRYEWLAEVERLTSGVTAEPISGLHLATTLVERMERMAHAEFGATLPPDLQAVFDRANQRKKEPTDG